MVICTIKSDNFCSIEEKINRWRFFDKLCIGVPILESRKSKQSCIESNFCKAIQVNLKFADFEFYFKIDHVIEYLCEVRRISVFK